MAQIPACTTWDFTIGTKHIDLDKLKSACDTNCKKWTFQEEKGEETGFNHYQGRISLKVKTRLSGVVKLFDNKNFHWSITSNTNKDNCFYVTKEDTRINGPWKDDDDKPMYIPRQIREIPELFSWQNTIVEDRLIWNTRNINIVIDEKGNTGKSILRTYVGVNQIGRSLPYSKDYRDFMRMVMNTKKVPLYIFDIPRSINKENLFQFFSGVETLKDGYAFDDRYHFREEYFDCPNIWIFLNVVPERSYLSDDRWKIWKITEDKHLKPYDTVITKVITE